MSTEQRIALSVSGSGVRLWLPPGASTCVACGIDPAAVLLTNEQAKDLAVLLREATE